MSTKRSVSILVVIFAVVSVAWPTSSGVARSGAAQRVEVECHACLVVADDGTELFARRAGVPLPMASTTKIATALVARSLAPDLDVQLRVSARAAATPGVRLTLEEGEMLTVEELLSVLLMASSNQAAVTLAEGLAGSEAAFVQAMNALAARSGATGATFVNAHGLDAPGHSASARDLYALSAELLDDPVLAEIVARSETTVTTQGRDLVVENTNELLGEYPGVLGVKTGFTADAGNVLVAAAERHGRRVTVVVMRATDSFASASTLLDHGFARLARGILLAKMTPMTDLVFDPGGSLSAVVGRTVRGITDPDEVSISFEPHGDIRIPVSPGTVVGTAVVLDRGGAEVGSSPVVASGALGSKGDGGWISGALTGLISGLGRILPGEQ